MQRSPSVAARAATDQAPPIDTNALIYSAQMVSGNFAPMDPALAARVTRLVDWLNAQPPLSLARKSDVELQLRKLLANRLRLAADRARLPAIAGEVIKRPIFVIGFGRTGTTLIHSLLAEDPGALAPKWWHTHEPSPPPGEGPVVETRIELAAQDLDRLLHQAPGLLTLHPYWDKRGHCLIEDEEIFTLDFHNAYPSLLYRVPALAMIIDASNIAAAYQFHREFLQHLQWNQPGKHWVVKGIYHQFVLDELFRAYPDAVCTWPHRDPVEVYPSMLAITAVLYGAITDWTTDFKLLGPAFVASIRESLNATLANPLVDDKRIFHIDFATLSRDPTGTIRRAYAQWGMPYTHEFESRVQAWLADPSNGANRYGRYDYRPEPYGLSREMLAETFADYRKRFCGL
jgi:Sulfotransferase family